jgi:hypothetical protein
MFAEQEGMVKDFLPTFLNYPQVWPSMVGIAKVMSNVLVILVFYFVDNDFRYKLARQHIIDGYSRFALCAQYLSFNVFLTLCNLVCVVSLVGMYGEVSGDQTFMSSFDPIVLGRLVMHDFLLFGLALLFALSLRSVVAAMFAFFTTSFILEALVVLVVKRMSGVTLEGYMPFQILGEVTPIFDLNKLPNIFQLGEVSQITYLVCGGYILAVSLMAYGLCRVRNV